MLSQLKKMMIDLSPLLLGNRSRTDRGQHSLGCEAIGPFKSAFAFVCIRVY